MRKKRIIILFLFVMLITCSFSGVSIAHANGEHYNSKAALLMDYHSGEILFDQNSTQRLQIASMVKIMTLLLCFEEIDAGNLCLDDMVTISENASSMGGSQAFLDANCDYKVEDLIKSIIVASANDSCVAMAERISGSVESFVEKMNKKAESIGLCDTYFVNCTGLPAPNQYSCAKDVAIMSRELFGFEKYFEYSKIWMFDFVHPSGRITGLTNTNKLIKFYDGCDGGKTGYTDEARSCLSATAVKGNTRFISVIVGAPTAKERNAEISKMFDIAFAKYENKNLVLKNEKLGEIDVVGGKEKTVSYCAQDDLFKLVNKGETIEPEYIMNFTKIKAPVVIGDIVGTLDVYLKEIKIGSVNLLAMSNINKAKYADLVGDLVENW